MLPSMSPAKPLHFKTVAVIGKYMADGIVQSLSDLAAFLAKTGHAVVLETETARNRTTTPLKVSI